MIDVARVLLVLLAAALATDAPESKPEDLPVVHFDLLTEAEDFLTSPGGGRLVGFFSDVKSAEHDVFVAVATQLAREPHQAPLLGRANVGRKSSGATLFLVPRGAAIAPNGSAVPPLLLYQYRLPASANAPEVHDAWRKLGASAGSRRGADIPHPSALSSQQMWEQLLEAEAVAVHRFAQAGALSDVEQLTPSLVDALKHSASSIGLLALPPTLAWKMRDYYLRRLYKLAAAYPQLRCSDGEGDGRDEWTGRPKCSLAPKHEAVRFVHAPMDTSLFAVLANSFGLTPAKLAPLSLHPIGAQGEQLARTDALFVLLQKDPKTSEWQAHSVADDGPPTLGAMKELCENELPPSASPDFFLAK